MHQVGADGVVRDAQEDDMSEQEGTQTYYQLAPRGPALDLAEIENETGVVEVIISWGDVRDVLHVAHVTDDSAFVLGSGGEVDFLMHSELVGDRAVLVEGRSMSVPRGATGFIEVDGEQKPLQVGDVLTMSEGTSVSMTLGAFQIRVRGVREGRRVAPRARASERGPRLFVGGTMAVAGLLFAIMSLTPGRGMALTGSNIDMSSRLVNFVVDAQEEDIPEFEEESGPGEAEAAAERGDEGQAGDREAPDTGRRFAVEGNARPEDARLSREEAREQATTAGILGVLRGGVSIHSPTSVYGAETAIGADPMSALGNLMGADLGDSFGYGGLGLNGTGRHGGGPGLGTVGVGTVGDGISFGTCSGGRPCARGEYGRSAANFRRRQPSAAPDLGRPEVHGSLSREVIRRVVRRHRNELKFCFERALQSNPSLEGRVTTQFVISPSGSVAAATIASSSLNHRETESCVRGVVQRMSFPTPENSGAVRVSYPFVFGAR